ncbi:Coiled-coil domain-containing protein 12 [Mycoemilia scoparia]|uniref:Coiled-coil domain-containing protein 12 n=1 Tax=Mycoemilia scoparia TaxID=417184 RepID=A0A9W8A449_9FUNG|nr:Coiled-coil domain-containing protein 12 [Mycoemilia scoparia]
MEDEARKRKERLQAIRKAGNKPKDSMQDTGTSQGDKKTQIKFRNYKPSERLSDDLDQVIPKGPQSEIKETVEKQMSGVFEKVLEEVEEKVNQENVDIAQIALKKPNMDLKRDLEKRLEKLESKTQAAIAEIIRQRIKGQSKDSSDGLSEAVMTLENQKAKASHNNDGDED